MSRSGTLFEIEVLPDEGEPYRVEADSRDVSQWERTIRGRSLGMLQGVGVRMEYLEELAHITSKRRGQYDGNLSSFRESCAIVPIDPDADAAAEGESGLDPTPPEA